MHIDFKFHNLESSDAIKAYAADKLSKLQKYVTEPLGAHVTFSVEKRLHCIDVSLSMDGEHHQGRAERRTCTPRSTSWSTRSTAS